MHENEKFDRLDRALCRISYQRLYDSLSDPTKFQSTKLKSKFYADTLSMLERFVEEVLLNHKIPFELRIGNEGKKEYVPSSLAYQYFEWMFDFIDVVNILSPDYEYSERVSVFIICCDALGLLSERLDRINQVDLEKNYSRFGRWGSAPELFNILVQEIRNEWKINNFQATVNGRKKEADDRYEFYCEYVDSLFYAYARLLVLRIDLFYEKQYANSISISDMQDELDHLFRNARKNSLFKFMKGFIAKLEYGIDKGFHWHILFFFDGSKRKNSSHIHLTEEIGKYWKNIITKSLGAYWNINANVGHYDKLGRRGIGVINWNDTESRRNLKSIIRYFFKMDQFIKPKLGPKVKLYRKGDFPETGDNKLGKPRKQEES